MSTRGWLLVALLGASMLSCTARTPTALPVTTPTLTIPPTSTATPTSPQASGLPSVAAVVEQVVPAVVSIDTQQVQRDFFSLYVVPGAGTGVIIRDDGYIVTNSHVIQGAQEITVNLPDGRSLPAQVVGSDPEGDLAVIRIDAHDLPTLPFGSSEELRVGDWVIALGNALALKGGPTVTVGIVSALGRTILTDQQRKVYLYDTIQTDAAINEGNSGGPLVNLKGELVGINTAIEGSAQGIGFAIASRVVEPTVAALIEQGRVVRPYLGVCTTTVTASVARQLRLSVTAGVVLWPVGGCTTAVVPGGPASRAGLQQGDVLVSIQGQPLGDEAEFRRVLWLYQPGETITVEYVRGNQTRTTEVTLSERPTAASLGSANVA